MTKHKARPHRHIGLQILIGGLLVLVTASLASHHQPVSYESAVFYHLYYLPDWLTLPTLVLTLTASSWGFFGLVIWAWVTQHKWLAVQWFLGAGSAWLVAMLLKTLINRPRPFVLLDNVVPREVFVTGQGFPSGHTAVATALALILAPQIKAKWHWPLAVWIVLIGYSRMYLGVHLPLDVIGGFGIGLMMAGLLELIDSLTPIGHSRSRRP